MVDRDVSESARHLAEMLLRYVRESVRAEVAKASFGGSAAATASDSDLITKQEAAALARCSERSIDQWAKSGRITRRGSGRRPLYSRAELLEYLSGSDDASAPDSETRSQLVARLVARGG